MARLKDYQLSKEEQYELLKKFFTCIASLKSYKEVADFFRDLLNSEEMIMLARRLKAASLLESGLTFDEVAQQLRMGKQTLTKINFWLRYGRGGYLNAVLRLQKADKREEAKRIHRARNEDTSPSRWFRKKYVKLGFDELVELKDEIEDTLRIRRRKQKAKKEYRPL